MLPDEMMSPRCRCRPLTMADVEAVHAYSRDPEWGRFLPVPQPYLREHAEFYIQMQLDADRSRMPTWAVEFEGRVIGITNLIHDPAKASAEIGISLDRRFWGRGVAAEVLSLLIRTAMKDLSDLQRIEGFADQRNTRSRALLERLGFAFEGVLRSRRSVRGERIDDAVYSLLRGEEAKLPS